MLGFLGLGGGGDIGPSPEEIEAQRKDLWQTYSGWLKDEERSYAKKVGSTKARLAAGGVASKSEGWKNVMSQLESEHQKTMKGLRETETYGQLEDLRERATRSTPKYRQSESGYERWREAGYEQSGDTYVGGGWEALSEEEAASAERALAEQGMSTEQWYESRYGEKKEGAPGDVEDLEEGKTRTPKGLVGQALEVISMGKQARSPFAGMG